MKIHSPQKNQIFLGRCPREMIFHGRINLHILTHNHAINVYCVCLRIWRVCIFACKLFACLYINTFADVSALVCLSFCLFVCLFECLPAHLSTGVFVDFPVAFLYKPLDVKAFILGYSCSLFVWELIRTCTSISSYYELEFENNSISENSYIIITNLLHVLINVLLLLNIYFFKSRFLS